MAPHMRNLFILTAAIQLACTANATPSLFGTETNAVRLVLVGDSITGLSRNHSRGFAHQLDAAFAAARPGAPVAIAALGGSGQSVASWRSVERRSRTDATFLDVKGIDVKTELDRPADVLIVMLGMNDVLAPYISDTPESLDAWQGNLAELVDALKTRLAPHVVGLASITPCTEDPASPKNRLIAQMNARVAALAAQIGARYLPASETAWSVQRDGRARKPDFHVTSDFVHPSEAGHIAIALAMLEGLGETAAARWLKDNRLAPLLQKAADEGPGLSWRLESAMPTDAPGVFRFAIACSWAPRGDEDPERRPQLSIDLPDGWRVIQAPEPGFSGAFLVEGAPDRLRNLVTLRARLGETVREAVMPIPAPWRVAAPLPMPFWREGAFDLDRARRPVDEAIAAQAGFAVPIEDDRYGTIDWRAHFASVDYTGLDDPDSIDFASLAHAATHDGGYAARRIHSDRARDAVLAIGKNSFAGESHLTVWLNGTPVYQDKLKRVEVPVKLLAGWNTLVLKSAHVTWQWQVAAGLRPAPGDALDALRYALP